MDEVEIVYQAIRHVDRARVMIDVGACTGASFEKFARDDWTVYAFEPDANNRAECLRMCQRLPTVTVDARAVSNRNEKECAFFASRVSAGISSLSTFHPSHKESETVETVTLDTFCR